MRVLELGCGAGANIPFFKAIGAEYFGIDGSEFVIDRLHKQFPDLVDRIMYGNFVTKTRFPILFDLVLDRASTSHNSTEADSTSFR